MSLASRILASLSVRQQDRRATWVGSVTLFSVIAGHSVLETARDTLFLRSLPVQRLPLAYLAIALLTFPLSRLNSRALARLQRRGMLSATLIVAALATAGMYFLLDRSQHYAPFWLYVWTGLVATTLVVQFWILLGDVLDVSQARRVFSLIASGGALGAAAGSLLARVALSSVSARGLLLLGAALFGLAALFPWGFAKARVSDHAPVKPPPADALSVREIWKASYTRRVLLLAILAPIALTVSDYLFKSSVAAHVKPADLGRFFSGFYALVGVAAFVFQLALAPFILRVMGVGYALFVLPLLMLCATGAFALGPALASAMVLKGVDGTLRHSVHRGATEILYLPFDTPTRERLRSLAGSVCDRGGQALASLATLLMIYVGAGPRWLAAGLVALIGVWSVSLIGLRREYADRFRQRLRAGSIETRSQVPALDLESLEALLHALGSSDDGEVSAALEMFERYGRATLVSPLILYHPSPQIVLKALENFGAAPRSEVQAILPRLFAHPDARIRAAAIQLCSDEDLAMPRLLALSNSEAPEVRAAALSRLVGSGRPMGQAVRQQLEALFEEGPNERLALARIAVHLPPELSRLVQRLTECNERQVVVETARSLAQAPRIDHVDALLKALRFHEARRATRRALVEIGAPAFERLARELASSELSLAFRLHIPRSISPFATQAALDVLVTHLGLETNGRLVYKCLRAIGRMRTDVPDLSIDPAVLTQSLRSALVRTADLLRFRLRLERFANDQASIDPRPVDLLTRLLAELHRESLEHVFRLLHIASPETEFELIYDGFSNNDPTTRVASRELLDQVVQGGLKEAVLALTDDTSPAHQLVAAAKALALDDDVDPSTPDECIHGEVLFADLLREPDVAVRTLSAAVVQAARSAGVGMLDALYDQAVNESARVTLPELEVATDAR